MSSRTMKSSLSSPKIADARVYAYDEMIKYQERLNDSNDFQFDIDDVEKEFKCYNMEHSVNTPMWRRFVNTFINFTYFN